MAALHSYTSVETFAMGYPILAPSARLLASWHSQYSLISHRCAGNGAYVDNLTAHGGLLGPNSHDESIISEWLQHLDFYSWPGVEVFDSMRSLVRLVMGTTHELREQQSQVRCSVTAAMLLCRRALTPPFFAPPPVHACECGGGGHAG